MVDLNEFKSRYEALKAIEQDKDKIIEVWTLAHIHTK